MAANSRSTAPAPPAAGADARAAGAGADAPAGRGRSFTLGSACARPLTDAAGAAAAAGVARATDASRLSSLRNRSSAANGLLSTSEDCTRAARSRTSSLTMPDISSTGVPPSRGWRFTNSQIS